MKAKAYALGARRFLKISIIMTQEQIRMCVSEINGPNFRLHFLLQSYWPPG